MPDVMVWRNAGNLSQLTSSFYLPFSLVWYQRKQSHWRWIQKCQLKIKPIKWFSLISLVLCVSISIAEQTIVIYKFSLKRVSACAHISTRMRVRTHAQPFSSLFGRILSGFAGKISLYIAIRLLHTWSKSTPQRAYTFYPLG